MANRENLEVKHGSRSHGPDLTLCGLSLDRDDPGDGSAPVPETATLNETVTCKDCQRIISHCQVHFTVAYRVR